MKAILPLGCCPPPLGDGSLIGTPQCDCSLSNAQCCAGAPAGWAYFDPNVPYSFSGAIFAGMTKRGCASCAGGNPAVRVVDTWSAIHIFGGLALVGCEVLGFPINQTNPTETFMGTGQSTASACAPLGDVSLFGRILFNSSLQGGSNVFGLAHSPFHGVALSGAQAVPSGAITASISGQFGGSGGITTSATYSPSRQPLGNGQYLTMSASASGTGTGLETQTSCAPFQHNANMGLGASFDGPLRFCSPLSAAVAERLFRHPELSRIVHDPERRRPIISVPKLIVPSRRLILPPGVKRGSECGKPCEDGGERGARL